MARANCRHSEISKTTENAKKRKENERGISSTTSENESKEDEPEEQPAKKVKTNDAGNQFGSRRGRG